MERMPSWDYRRDRDLLLNEFISPNNLYLESINLVRFHSENIEQLNPLFLNSHNENIHDTRNYFREIQEILDDNFDSRYLRHSMRTVFEPLISTAGERILFEPASLFPAHVHPLPEEPTLDPRTDVSRDSGWNFSHNGLHIDVQALRADLNVTVNGETVNIPQGTVVGRMDFTPWNRSSFISGTTTATLVAGIDGLQEFFEEMDERPEKPVVLIGHTNRKMAKAIRKHGFEIHGDENSEARWQVVGDIETLRAEIAKLETARDDKGRSFVDILRLRLQKLEENLSQHQRKFAHLYNS